MKVLSAVAVLTALSSGSASGGEHFACNMSALTKAERVRHHEVAVALAAAVDDKRELSNGYAFRLPPGELVTAAEWISLERRCCPFFTFELRQTRDGGPVWLRVMGAQGVKSFIRAEFGF